MTAALPTLPSIRAKELESRASANNNNESSVDLAHTSVPSQNERSEESAKRNEYVPSSNLGPSATSSTRFHSDAERSEQLAGMHEKEQKVFGGLPPLESNVACDAIHHYISTTSSFLNSFIADVNASHDGIDHKLTVLEKQMSMLESKISSMPDLFPDEDESDDVDKEINEKEDTEAGGEAVAGLEKAPSKMI